jgi:hypothetical protein
MARPFAVVQAVALAVVAGLDAFLLYGATVAHPVGLREAVERFRAGPGAGPGDGVYLYDTTGYERVGRLGVRRDYPRVSARILRNAGACGAREEVVLFREHTETYTSCHGVPTGFGTRLTYFFVPSVTALSCDARGACRDAAHDVSATLDVVDSGPGTAVVGGVPLPCRRVVVTTVLTGSNAGGARRDLCVRPDGLVLTERRSVGVVARSAFVGRVAYSEEATFTLRSTVPVR